MKRGLVAFVSVFFLAAVIISTFGCAPDAGKMYKEKRTEVENKELRERVTQLEKEVASLKKELRNCLESRIESLGPETE
ncbi:MAG: hypothetical protein JW984_14030 [Deltaproteobacteria bacterium]|uniref:Uncharacterized protein n=1 Tax=Candidatus Zymogenus saltonus TaxID=2844893 RepID=A0A9D8KH01_9DELT|nr:hypothetical protein [Candidatus Zymogenus saltonus]